MTWAPGWVEPREAPALADLPNCLDACRAIGARLGFPQLWGFQEHVFAAATEYHPNTGKWARDRVMIEVPRQNGKSTILRIRSGLGLLMGEGMSITAQRLHVAERIWHATTDLMLAEAPERVLQTRFTQGRQMLRQRAPSGRETEWLLVSDTPAAARSHTHHTILVDEGAWINQRWLPAALPTRVTIDDAQTWQASNSGDEASETWNTEIETGLDAQEAGSTAVAVFGWGATWDDDPHSYDTWQKAIPTLDLPGGVQSKKLQEDLDRGMPLADFRREYLGLGSGRRDPVVSPADWARCHGDVGDIRSGGWIAVDTSPDSAHSAIVAAWHRPDKRLATALITAGDGDDWLWHETAKAVRRCRARGVVVDGRNPAAHIKSKAQGARIKCVTVHGTGTAAAAAGFAAAVKHQRLIVEASPLLDDAARDAIRRPLGEGWAMNRDRREGKAYISSLVAVSLAVAQTETTPTAAPIGGLN